MSDDRKRRGRLHRDRDNGVICGVCAGIADHYGFDLGIVRAAFIVTCIFAPPFMVTAYLILCFVLPARGGAQEAEPAPEPQPDPEEKAFWQGVNRAPKDSFVGIRHSFRQMEDQLQRMERYVTSRHFELDREFRDLGG